MTEEKKTKASRNYDTDLMQYDLLGKTFTVKVDMVDVVETVDDGPETTKEAWILNEAQKRAVLIGYANMTIDSIASLTIEDGFTKQQRLAKLGETHTSIDNGTYAKESKKGGGITTQKVIDLTDTVKKIMRQQYDQVTEEAALAIKKYDIDLYNDWLENKDSGEED